MHYFCRLKYSEDVQLYWTALCYEVVMSSHCMSFNLRDIMSPSFISVCFMNFLFYILNQSHVTLSRLSCQKHWKWNWKMRVVFVFVVQCNSTYRFSIAMGVFLKSGDFSVTDGGSGGVWSCARKETGDTNIASTKSQCRFSPGLGGTAPLTLSVQTFQG